MHKYSFDSKCLDLAEHFLPREATQSVKNELAQAIQDAIENFWCGLPINTEAGIPYSCSSPNGVEKCVHFFDGKMPDGTVRWDAPCHHCGCRYPPPLNGGVNSHEV